jgi:hypothetical protein
VVDDVPSMKVWESTVREFAGLLAQIGAFRAVHQWRLERSADRVTLTDDRQLRRVPAESLLSLGPRQLTLVVSDWMDQAWQSDLLWRTLRRWSRTMPTALLNPLPVRLWQRTNLTAYPSALGPGPPGTPNAGLSSETPHLPSPTSLSKLDSLVSGWRKSGAPLARPSSETARVDGRATSAAQWIALPTVALNAHSLDRWARMLMRSQPTGCAGVIIPREGELRFPAPISPPGGADPAEAVERFRLRCSPAAFRLAALCAIQPTVSLPVIQLIRQTMVPEADTGDIAEVVVNALIVQRRTSSSGTLQFRFHEGARQRLLTHLSTDDAWQLFRGISRHLAHEASRGFAAMVAHPAGVFPLPADLAPFAEATDATLRLLGIETAQERRRIIMQTVEGSRAVAGTEAGENEPALRITVLGRTAVIRDGAARPLGPLAAALMLRLLLGNGERVSIYELSMDVWRTNAERPTQRAERTIARRVRDIGEAVGHSQLVMVSNRAGIQGYRLQVDRAQVDMYEFEDLVAEAVRVTPGRAIDLLQRALAMWGQPMPEVAHLPFAQGRVGTLQETALTARRLLVTSYRDVGRSAEALRLAEAYLAESNPDDPVLTELAQHLREQAAEAEVSGQHTYAVYLRDIHRLAAPDVTARRIDVLVITAASTATRNLNACLTHSSFRLSHETDTHRLLGYAGRPSGILYAVAIVSDDSATRTGLSHPKVRRDLTAAALPLMSGPVGRSRGEMIQAVHQMAAIAELALTGSKPGIPLHEAYLIEHQGGFQNGRFPLASRPNGPAVASCEVHLVEQQPPLAQRLVIAVEIAGYGRLSMTEAAAAQERLNAIVREVLSTVVGPAADASVQQGGDGVILLLPVGTDPLYAVPLLLRRMSERVAVFNAAEPSPLKLRMAIHFGVVASHAQDPANESLVTVRRLVDSAPLRQATAERDFAAILSDRLHQLVAGYLSLSTVPAEVATKSLALQAWLWLPAAMD